MAGHVGSGQHRSEDDATHLMQISWVMNANPAPKHCSGVAVGKFLLPSSSDSPQMSTISIQTWRDLLIPNQSPVIGLSSIGRRSDGRQRSNTSAFAPQVWDPTRLPSVIRLLHGLPSMMHGHLNQLLDTHLSSEAAGTQFTTFDETFTPRNELARLRTRCNPKLEFNYESGVGVIADCVSEMVRHVYYALLGTNPEFEGQSNN
jgi:hypothetical protein